MNRPEQFMIDHALQVASLSPCRSKRGVVLYDPSTGASRGSGFNGPPRPLTCPGREHCAGSCGKRSVHAEVRALRDAETYSRNGHPAGRYDLVHVELGADGGVVACGGPSCWQCAREILDVGFIGGVWLYEDQGAWIGENGGPEPGLNPGAWRRYTAEEFYRVTFQRCGMAT